MLSIKNEEAFMLKYSLKTETANIGPCIMGVSDKQNGTITIDSVMEILGSRLKFDPKDAGQGVLAVSGSKTVRCASVIENNSGRLIVLLNQVFRQEDNGCITN